MCLQTHECSDGQFAREEEKGGDAIQNCNSGSIAKNQEEGIHCRYAEVFPVNGNLRKKRSIRLRFNHL